MFNVLGIETSCDETAVSVVADGRHILSNIIFSQEHLHKQFGGVFPEIASRSHEEVLPKAIDLALKKAQISPQDLDLIAATHGPGLIGALLVGLNAAKALSIAWEKPFVGVNHIEAHLYSAMMAHLEKNLYPALGVVVSGGHTLMVKILDLCQYELIGETVDDAIGESFDKVASMLDLAYPGGPKLEKLALLGNPTKFSFKAGKVKRSPYDFSFSGLKTSVLYALKKSEKKKKEDLAASFQETALNDILSKSLLAIQSFNPKAVFLGGGVTQNQRLRELFTQKCPLPVFFPPTALCTDNAAMIAGLGYQLFYLNSKGHSLELEALPRLSFSLV